MKLKTFTIIESKWARGGKNGTSMLRNSSGNKCCLGFLCRQAGAKKITGTFLPYSLLDAVKVVPELATGEGKGRSCIIATINDDDTITDTLRKKRLAPLFRKIGWKPVYKP